jgi:UDP-galactopyranose mutase
MSRHDWVIVGAGFTGAVLAERIASQLGQRVLVIDRRDHIGGNAHDALDDAGLLVHTYGPHIFHTNSPKVWSYLSRFTEWRPYFHRVLGMVEGQLVPIPFNLNSLYALFPPRLAARLEDRLTERYAFGARVPILQLRQSTDGELKSLAQYVYQQVFEGYTKKQWGLAPDELDASVTGRVPVIISRDDRYFQDTYQAMPLEGYTRMFERMLDHPSIEVQLGSDFADVAPAAGARVIFTGAIDEYFRYEFGPLEYRSLRFRFDTLDVEQHQPVGTINFPNNFDYTRTTEQKHLTGQRATRTTLVTEYPEAHRPGENEAYYPVPREVNQQLYQRYLALAPEAEGQLFFAGRLADYKYYNMDQAVARALQLFEQKVATLPA